MLLDTEMGHQVYRAIMRSRQPSTKRMRDIVVSYAEALLKAKNDFEANKNDLS